MLFLAAFIMMQLCALHMSVQGYQPAPEAELHHMAGHMLNQPAPQPDQPHNMQSACAVSGCVLPVPLPPVIALAERFARKLTTPDIQTLHGLPPERNERPPISVIA